MNRLRRLLLLLVVVVVVVVVVGGCGQPSLVSPSIDPRAEIDVTLIDRQTRRTLTTERRAVDLGVETCVTGAYPGYEPLTVCGTVNGPGERWTFYLVPLVPLAMEVGR